MKAILVIDMPTHCKDCALNYDNQNCLGIEVFTKVSIEDDRPSWCPLKPMPQKKVGDDLYERYGRWTLSDEKELSYRVGFNDCLAEITGETE